MTDVPKFVRTRLSQPGAGEHPDANVLAAFAEGALTKREREQVLAHMSGCAGCRDVVALALPEMPASAPSRVAGRRWARWPLLRWAGVAAAVAVVAAAVLVENAWRPAAKSAGEDAAARQMETKQAAASAADANAAPERAQERKESGESKVSRRPKTAIAAGVKKDAGVAAAMSEVARPQSSNEPAQARAQDELAVRPPAPASGPVAVAGGAAGAPAHLKRQAPTSAAAAPSARDSVEVMAQASEAATQRAKGEDRQRFALDRRDGERPPAAPSASGAMMKTALNAAVRWRISSAGKLETSNDAGQMWRIVQVGEPGTILRSLSAVGADLWAGGTGGALYHSADNGRTWERVTVQAADELLKSDIARVEFRDTKHGTVTTTTGETWTTSDAGANWARAR